MKKKLSILMASCLAIGSLTGCSSVSEAVVSTTIDLIAEAEAPTAVKENIGTATVAANQDAEDEVNLTDKVEAAISKSYAAEDEEVDTVITVNNGQIEVTGDGVDISDDAIAISKGGSYMFTGEYSGQVLVDVDDEDVQLKLHNFDIENDDDSPIEIVSADEVTLTLMSGTINSIVDSSSYIEEATEDVNNSNGAIYSEDDLARLKEKGVI